MAQWTHQLLKSSNVKSHTISLRWSVNPVVGADSMTLPPLWSYYAISGALYVNRFYLDALSTIL